MSDATLLYWGILVTAFLAIAALITARDLVESRLEAKGYAADETAEPPIRPKPTSPAPGTSRTRG